MSVQNVSNIVDRPAKKNGLTAGITLIVIGLGLLASQWFLLAQYIPLGLGLIFTIAGILNRKAGLLIPGGIIGGAGLGILVMTNNWFAPMGSVAGGGVFLLVMSLGWFGITLLSKLFTDDTQVWPLFPGACMALIGGLVLMGERGFQILEVIGAYWPLALVAAGLSILYRWWRDQK